MNIIKPSFKLLKRYYKNPEKNLKLLLSNFLENENVEAHQGVTRTVYGVIRRERTLDYIIGECADRKAGKLERDVLILLRIGIYLLIYSDSYREYAVVNETVNRVRGKARGFVNAVLRKCATDKDVISQKIANLKDFSVKYSMSQLLIENLKAISGELESDLRYLDSQPEFHVRINSQSFKFDEVREILHAEGLAVQELRPFDSFRVGGAGSGGRLKTLIRDRQCLYYQNTASQLISMIAARYSVNRVLDCCAAPGTKSVTLSLLKPGLKIAAADISLDRIRMLKEFSRNFDLGDIVCGVSDAKRLSFRDAFDFIILDAPCTSAGTLRKNPDLKLKINNEMVSRNAGEQSQILQAVLSNFPGAMVLYSVCSFIKEETEDVLSGVLNGEMGKRMESVDVSGMLDELGFRYKKGEHGIYLLPNENLANDLFYLSLLKPSHN